VRVMHGLYIAVLSKLNVKDEHLSKPTNVRCFLAAQPRSYLAGVVNGIAC
jgi:hypothetical protein